MASSSNRKVQLYNVGLLSLSYMLHSSILFMQTSTTTTASRDILKNQGWSENLSSLPISLIFITSAFLPPILSFSFVRFGFKLTFLVCMLFGVTGAVIATLSIYWQNFILICLASALIGVPNTAGNFFRFTVLQLVEPIYASKSISTVLVSGLIASFLGPFVADKTYQVFQDYLYMGVYISIVAFYSTLTFLMTLVIYPTTQKNKGDSNIGEREKNNSIKDKNKKEFQDVAKSFEHDDESKNLLINESDEENNDKNGPRASSKIDQPPTAEPQEVIAKKRKLVDLLRSPGIMVSVTGAGVSYLVMIGLMSVIPVIMEDRDFEFQNVTNTMTIHGVGMFLPFFIVGWAIDLIGDVWMSSLGLVILSCSILFFILSGSLWSYFVGMAFVGVGWSFTFLSCTTLLSKHYSPLERPTVQSLNDVIVFGLVAISTTVSLPVYNSLSEAGFMWFMMACTLTGLAITLFYGFYLKIWSKSERQPLIN